MTKVYDVCMTGHPELTRERSIRFLLFEIKHVFVYISTIFKLTDLFILYFFIQNVYANKNYLRKKDVCRMCRMNVGQECRMNVGLECRMKVGLECRMKVGLECRMNIGLECRMNVGLECRMKVRLECRMKVELECRMNIR